MRVFLDVGAHEGQTLEEVLEPEYGFDEVHAFEPMPAQHARLVALYGAFPAVYLYRLGLAGETGIRYLYGTNADMEASIYPTKNDVDATCTTSCMFLRASDFLATIPGGWDLTVKLNCEGAEVDILDDLITTEAIWRIDRMLVDFDVRKIPGMEHRETEVRKRLADIGYDRYRDSFPPGATHQDRIRNWLTA